MRNKIVFLNIHSVLDLGLKNLLVGSSINFVSKVADNKELEISKGIAGHTGNGTSGCFPTTVSPMERSVMTRHGSALHGQRRAVPRHHG